MEFQTDAQRACWEKVQAWMQDLFGEMVQVHPETGAFLIRAGSAVVVTEIHPWGDDDAVLQCYSAVVVGADLTKECLEYLLRKNGQVRFGAFLLADDAILFRQAILGSTCDKEEVRATVLAVASTADESDDEIRSRWGGERAVDIARRMGS